MGRFWIQNPQYGNQIWLGVWQDDEPLFYRPFDGSNRGWREIETIRVLPGQDVDLELRATLGDEQGPFHELVPGPAILMPGVVAWEVLASVSPNRVYWHGQVSAEPGDKPWQLRMEVPASRDFDIRKVRVRAESSDPNSNLHLGYRWPSGLWTTSTLRPENSGKMGPWWSNWRPGDETPVHSLFNDGRYSSAATWGLSTNTPGAYIKYFELELE